MRFRQNLYGRTSYCETFWPRRIRCRLSCVRFRSRFSLVLLFLPYFSLVFFALNFILVALSTLLCEVLQNTYLQIWNDQVMIRYDQVIIRWSLAALPYLFDYPSFLNKRRARRRWKQCHQWTLLSNQRRSLSKQRGIYSRIITKNAVQLGNKNNIQTILNISQY